MTCELRVLDSDLQFAGVIDAPASCQLTREHYGTGSFQINVRAGEESIGSFVTPGHIIVINNDGTRCGLVEDVELVSAQGTTPAMWKITGPSMKGLTNYRITIPPTQEEDPEAYGFDRISAPAETAIKHYLRRNITEPTDTKRIMEQVVLEPDSGRGANAIWRSRHRNLAVELQELSAYTEMGWTAFFDSVSDKIVFSVVPGADRTIGQTDNDPVVFSDKYENLEKYNYKHSVKGYRTTGYCGGAGEDEQQLIYTLGAEYYGRRRKEVFIDCGNVDDVDELRYYGSVKLSEHKEIISIDTDIVHNRTFLFEKNYFLGDFVSVNIGNLYFRTQIAGVKEVWEKGYKVQALFGDPRPTLAQVLRRT